MQNKENEEEDKSMFHIKIKEDNTNPSYGGKILISLEILPIKMFNINKSLIKSLIYINII